MMEISYHEQKATDERQSKRLVVSGINLDTADMSFVNGGLTSHSYTQSINLLTGGASMEKLLLHDKVEIEPAWSLSRLLALLPRGNTTVFHICMETYADESVYKVWDSCCLTPTFESQSPVEAIVRAIVWVNFNKTKIIRKDNL